MIMVAYFNFGQLATSVCCVDVSPSISEMSRNSSSVGVTFARTSILLIVGCLRAINRGDINFIS